MCVDHFGVGNVLFRDRSSIWNVHQHRKKRAFYSVCCFARLTHRILKYNKMQKIRSQKLLAVTHTTCAVEFIKSFCDRLLTFVFSINIWRIRKIKHKWKRYLFRRSFAYCYFPKPRNIIRALLVSERAFQMKFYNNFVWNFTNVNNFPQLCTRR